MWLAEESPIRKQDLALAKPFVNAAGTLGYAPDSHTMPFLDGLGAFITNPISRRPRQPAGNRACLPFPGGFLLHTGLPNPGISRVIRRYGRRWAGAPLPVIVHLLAEAPEALAEMVQKLEGQENVLGVELGLSPDCSPTSLAGFLSAAAGELPAAVCLGPEQLPVLLPALMELAPAAVVHLTAPRGILPGPDGALVNGRLHGPAIRPVMLSAVEAAVGSGLRVIVDGGIYEREQAEAFLASGVMAVGLGAALWGVDQGWILSLSQK
jgi:dihydroorotate dehydrogenase (NAD+) catalytic subunit